MYLKIKNSWNEKDLLLPFSKTLKIKELKYAIYKETTLKEKLQRLFYNGKELSDELSLEDYHIKPDDVILLHKSKIDETTKEVPPPENILLEATCNYYDINDLIDFRYGDRRAWYEAMIKKIFCKKIASTNNEESNLVFFIKPEEHVSNVPSEIEVGFADIRPRSYYIHKPEDFRIGMKVLVNIDLDNPTSDRGLWYDYQITKIDTSTNYLDGTLFCGEISMTEIKVSMDKEIMRIENVEAKYVKKPIIDPKKRKYPYSCTKCYDNEIVPCCFCGCLICTGKQNSDELLVCDECQLCFHMKCLSPPLENMPEDDWYCPECRNDTPIINLPEQQTTSNAPLSIEDLRPKNLIPVKFVGAIPGVKVGYRWKNRQALSDFGVHRPIIAGIHGQEKYGVYSLILSSKHEIEKDDGDEVIYIGAGGKNKSGRKNANQELTKNNRALALNCAAPLDNEKGATAIDWKIGRPIRVVRSSKLSKYSQYAPRKGYRYDGIYKVVKYYLDKEKSGLFVWKFLLRRDDEDLAPWHPDAPEYTIFRMLPEFEIPRPNMPMRTLRTNKRTVERKSPSESTSKQRKMSSTPYELTSQLVQHIDADKINQHLWLECKTALPNGKESFQKKIEEIFRCIICLEIVQLPVTLECGHNLCKMCLNESLEHCESITYPCPYCMTILSNKIVMRKMKCNEHLEVALKLIFS